MLVCRPAETITEQLHFDRETGLLLRHQHLDHRVLPLAEKSLHDYYSGLKFA